MHLQPNQQLLHYVLTEKIGEGGMGVVWSARDTSLERNVAIKFLPEHLAGDPERLARFEREAKLLAALDHPNIAAVYGLHEVEGQRFIAMELVPGEDLHERLQRGPLAIEDAVDVARQVAEALEAAHEQGVIHRDLKPANIKLTPEGKIKVLDLGLAKALVGEMSGDSASVSMSPTITSAGTIAGTLLGTAGYMSPEQAKGRNVDRRTDIWAFGVILSEMLTGKPLFQSETISETLAAVLRDPISADGLPAGIPKSVTRLLQRCLDRDPRSRLRDIGEARIALTSPAAEEEDDTATRSAAAPSLLGRVLPWALVLVLAAVAMLVQWSASQAPDKASELLTLVAPIPPDLRLPANQMGVIALSPDGKTLAMTLGDGEDRMLYVQQLDRGELVKMAGTENAATPVFSPDGEWLAFIADDKLKKIPVGGGTPLTLCDSDGNNRGADWGSDDNIVFSPHFTKPLMRVSGAGGEPTPLTTIKQEDGERTHRWPQSIPEKDLVLFTVGTVDSPESYDDAEIQAVRLSTGERVTLLERASMARYLPSGHLLFGREGFLFAVAFDIDKLEMRGKPVPVVQDVMGMRNSGVVHVGVATNGLLAYVAGTQISGQSRLAWRDRDGSIEPLPIPVDGYANPRISPDGKKIAVQIEGTATFDIWQYDIAQETLTRMTFEGDNTRPAWSPDGRKIAFSSVRDNALMNLYVTPADGSGRRELLVPADRFGENSGQVISSGWTPDGEDLILEFTDQNGSNIGLLSGATDEVVRLLETPAVEVDAQISPNGKWLAYSSDESGTFELYVTAFPEPGGKWQISSQGGIEPLWSPDGSRLFYRRQLGLYSVTVDESSGSFRAGRPTVAIEKMDSRTSDYDYDVLDNQRFLVIEHVGSDTEPPGVTVVVNWLDELERLVPR